jgi:hypothetical protein
MSLASLEFNFNNTTGSGSAITDNMSPAAYVALATIAIERLREAFVESPCTCATCVRARELLNVSPPDDRKFVRRQESEPVH